MSASVFSYDFTELGNGSETGCSFWMSQQNLVRPFSRALPRRAADLLDVFGAVYAADRGSKRCFRGVATGQRMQILRCPVREPGIWTSPGIGCQPRGAAGLGQRRRLGYRVRPAGLRLGPGFQSGFPDGRPDGIPGKSLAV